MTQSQFQTLPASVQRVGDFFREFVLEIVNMFPGENPTGIGISDVDLENLHILVHNVGIL